VRCLLLLDDQRVGWLHAQYTIGQVTTGRDRIVNHPARPVCVAQGFVFGQRVPGREGEVFGDLVSGCCVEQLPRDTNRRYLLC
jgi:hypothetical protein